MGIKPSFCVSFFEEPPHRFPQWPHHSTLPPAMCEDYNFPTSLSALVIFYFFLIKISAKWHLTAVLICTALAFANAEHRLMCGSAVRTSSLQKCLSHFAPSKLVCFLLSSCGSSLHILDAGPPYGICKHLLPSYGVSFLNTVLWFTVFHFSFIPYVLNLF